MVAHLLACHAPEILFMGHQGILPRVLFVPRRLAALAWASMGAIAATTLLDYLRLKLFGLAGIVLVTTRVALVYLLLLPLVRREVGAIGGQGDTLFAAMGLASAAVMETTPRACSGIYAALLHALRIEEARLAIGRLPRLRAGREGNGGPHRGDAVNRPGLVARWAMPAWMRGSTLEAPAWRGARTVKAASLAVERVLRWGRARCFDMTESAIRDFLDGVGYGLCEFEPPHRLMTSIPKYGHALLRPST